MDTKRTEIRLGEVEEETYLEEGCKVMMTTEEIEGNSERLKAYYEAFPNQVASGDQIRIDDGRLELELNEVEGTKSDEPSYMAAKCQPENQLSYLEKTQALLS